MMNDGTLEKLLSRRQGNYGGRWGRIFSPGAPTVYLKFATFLCWELFGQSGEAFEPLLEYMFSK